MTTPKASLMEQRALWRRQSVTIPSLHGGKKSWVPLILELLHQVGAGNARVMEMRPTLPGTIFEAPAPLGAAPSHEPLTWAEYTRFLKSVGLVHVVNGEVQLTELGDRFSRSGELDVLGASLASRFRLLGESLQYLAAAPATVDELDAFLRESYGTGWKSLGGVRSRIDWLDALGAIERVEERRWRVTPSGKQLLSQCELVSPDAVALVATETWTLHDAPQVIADLLAELRDGTRDHVSRSTYNIWIPAPADHPNKVENLRTVVNAAVDPIEREELLQFIATTFSVRRSSVDSMLPFLRASGLIREVGLGVFQSTPAARAWLESGDDVNFARVLHVHMRFVGEMLETAGSGIERNDLYVEAQRFGLNVDKSRWIASLLQDAGLLEAPKYGSLRATALGVALVAELPLSATSDQVEARPDEALQREQVVAESLAVSLDKLARSPMAMEQAAGRAFEGALRDCFRAMGFAAELVSGPGATDVLVRWADAEGAVCTAIVEAKSRASGSVSHTDVSDVALETHKTDSDATYVAVVAPSFSGDTIRDMAAKRGWVLLEASRLGATADAALALGVPPAVTARLFQATSGLQDVDNAIQERRRELAVISFVIEQLAEEAAGDGDAITSRDIFRDGRRTELQPTIEEIIRALTDLSLTAPGAVRVLEQNDDPRFSSFVLGYARPASSALRAIADAIESPLVRGR